MSLVLSKTALLFNLAWSETDTGLPSADVECISSLNSTEFQSMLIQLLY